MNIAYFSGNRNSVQVYTGSMVSESYDAWRQAPTLRERLADILRLVAQKPAAQSASEAHQMLEDAFEKVEHRMPGHQMYVHALSDFTEVQTGDQKVYTDSYERHLLRIGENGALEIRLLDATDTTEEQSRATTDLKVIFEKSGADGRYLRDAPTS